MHPEEIRYRFCGREISAQEVALIQGAQVKTVMVYALVKDARQRLTAGETE